MSYTITQENFASFAAYPDTPNHQLRWECLFVSPAWLKVWWQELGDGAELYLGAARQNGEIFGVAPLMIAERTASFLGSADVCDCLDFVVAPGREEEFFNILLDDLRQNGIEHLDLGPVRPDSRVMNHLVAITKERGYQVVCQPEDISLEIDLPASWEEYLAILTAKQRHEVRRKLRRLQEAGRVDYRFVADSGAVPRAMDTFLEMFTGSREDKATFLTTRMASFLRSLAGSMAETGLLRLGILELDTVPAAMIMCFDYHDCVYLYNSGYYPQYRSLSVGLLSKVLGIKASIEEGKKKFDLLKGNETYKYHLGGREVALFRCRITIK